MYTIFLKDDVQRQNHLPHYEQVVHCEQCLNRTAMQLALRIFSVCCNHPEAHMYEKLSAA
jgi:hypothetical protein